MTYLYYRTTTTGGQPKVTEETRSEWKHLANKENWRIVQLPNGYYQTEVSEYRRNCFGGKDWQDVTRRETLEGAESAIDGSIEHFAKKLEASAEPKVVKTFKNE
jgi:hypothetical protein